METLRLIILLVLSRGLTLAVQLWDKRHLSEEQRARSWNIATWGMALYWFGPASMLGWGWVTRKSALGLGGGILCAVSLFAIVVGADYLVATGFGLEP